MRTIAFFLFLICFAMAGTFFDQTSVDPQTAVLDQVNFIFSIIGPFMLLVIIIAAAAYVIGQMFGAETRAKATVWAQSLLVAVGICALLILLFYAMLPGFFSGTILSFDLALKIYELAGLAQSSFGILILVLIIIAAAAYVIGQFSGAETRARANVWANNILAGAILCAAIYVAIFNVIEPFKNTLFNSAIPYGGILYTYGEILIYISFLVSVIILATYLISQFFKVPEWEAYLNIELSNLMSTFVLFVGVVMMFAAAETVASSFYDSSTYSSAPEATIAFMTNNVSSSALIASMDVYKMQTCASILSTFAKRTGEFVLTQSFKVFPGLDTFVSATNVLTYTLVALYSTVMVQISFLHLVGGLMVPIVLPAGLLLRFFPPTRDAGAFLISLAFGFQIVYPTLYLLNAQIYAGMGGETYNSPTLLILSMCGPFKYGAAGYLFNPAAGPFTSISWLGSLRTLMGKFISEGFLNALSMAEFIPVIRNIASMSLLVLFMPALALMITIAFINVMTKFIVNKG